MRDAQSNLILSVSFVFLSVRFVYLNFASISLGCMVSIDERENESSRPDRYAKVNAVFILETRMSNVFELKKKIRTKTMRPSNERNFVDKKKNKTTSIKKNEYLC